jgi:hypothetical protein
MGRKKSINEKVKTVKTTADDQVKSPHHIPVNVYIQEAKNLSLWACEDMAALTAAGLDPGLLEDLPNRCEALSQVEALWYVEKNTRKEAVKKWASLSPQAYDLRKRLLRDFTFAFRKHSELLAAVRCVKKSNSQAALIQGLTDLCILGRNQTGLLAAVGFDMSLLDQAAQASSELNSVLARAINSRQGCSTAKKNRDRAYTYLKEAIDEIRTYGRFVFRDDKERLKGYTSNHLRLLNSKKPQKTKASAAEKQDNT